MIWVDTDGCESAAQYCKYFLTSGDQEHRRRGPGRTSPRPPTGTFPTGNYIGTLANDGTGLAPFHDFDSKVPADLKAELDQVKADIIAGKIKITSPSQPSELTVG